MATVKVFLAKGSIKLTDVRFHIVAHNIKEARAKAARGDWTEFNEAGADFGEVEIDPETISLEE